MFRVLEAIEASARTGQCIRIAPYERTVRPTLALEKSTPAVCRVRPVHAPSPNKGS
jgi:hypothetical protein